jgi:hypothetical protein
MVECLNFFNQPECWNQERLQELDRNIESWNEELNNGSNAPGIE